MKRIKIGKGYYQSGYGKGLNKSAVVYLINGFAYAKHKANSKGPHSLTGDLAGYVPVNAFKNPYGHGLVFDESSLAVKGHLPVNQDLLPPPFNVSQTH